MKITARRKGAPYSRPLEQMYTVTDAAWYVGVTRQTMSEWIKTGRVHPVYRPSRTCVRIPASSVNRYLKRQGRAVQALPRVEVPKMPKKVNYFRATEGRGVRIVQKPQYLSSTIQ
jgi:excisionase family DNA binding protein